MAEIMVARESYATEVNGERHSITKGVTRADADHPVVKQNPDYWEPIDATVHLKVARNQRVEQATRAPGEQREQRDAAPRPPSPARAKSAR